MIPSLLNLTRDYVIDNICSVESLFGLPETIGEWLFNRFLVRYYENGDRRRLTHGLVVFVDAYGPLIASKLNLCRSLVIINEFTECLLPMMTNLTELDLSHCQLGEEHEVIQHFTQMKHLRKLSFKNCAVNDNFLRKMTIPCRVLKKGVLSVEELDLSCNSKITDKSLSYISCLCRINILILSGTSITTTAAKTFATKLGLVVVSDLRWKPTQNEGWSKGLIEFWTNRTFKSRLPNAYRSNVDRYDTSPTKYFYSHQKARLRLVEELKSSFEPTELPVIALLRYPRFSHETSTSEVIVGTRKVKVLNPSSSPPSVVTFGAIDDDMLKGYLGCETTKRNCNRNLFETLNMLEK